MVVVLYYQRPQYYSVSPWGIQYINILRELHKADNIVLVLYDLRPKILFCPWVIQYNIYVCRLSVVNSEINFMEYISRIS